MKCNICKAEKVIGRCSFCQQSPPMRSFGVRADDTKIALANKLGINTGELFRKALDQEILRKSKACPTCGRKSK